MTRTADAIAGLLQTMPVLGEIHGSMYLGVRMVGAGTPSPTSIYRCYRSCFPSLPGDEGEVVQTRVIWCASSLLVTRGGQGMVATSSRVCPASFRLSRTQSSFLPKDYNLTDEKIGPGST